MKITKGLIEGALIGGGLGALLGAAGGKKSTVAAGAVGGAVVGGAVGYGLQGLEWDLSKLKFPNPFAGLENWFNNLGKGLSQWEKGIGKWEQGVEKSVSEWEHNVSQAFTHPVTYPGFPLQEAAVQPATGGAVSPATSPIHGTAVYLPRVVQLEAGKSIKGVPLFGPFPQYKLSPKQVRKFNEASTPEQWIAAGGQVKTEIVNGVPVTWYIYPGQGQTRKIRGYMPIGYVPEGEY